MFNFVEYTTIPLFPLPSPRKVVAMFKLTVRAWTISGTLLDLFNLGAITTKTILVIKAPYYLLTRAIPVSQFQVCKPNGVMTALLRVQSNAHQACISDAQG